MCVQISSEVKQVVGFLNDKATHSANILQQSKCYISLCAKLFISNVFVFPLLAYGMLLDCFFFFFSFTPDEPCTKDVQGLLRFKRNASKARFVCYSLS